MKLHVWSDLHLAMNGLHPSFQKRRMKADVLIIAGDTIEPRHLIDHKIDIEITQYFKHYEKVFIVLGNHDFYNVIYDDAISIYKNYFSQYPNVHVLNDEVYEHNGVSFVGGTLWTNYNNHNPINIEACRNWMPDFDWMYMSSSSFISPEFIISKHQMTAKYIESRLIAHDYKPHVVITHHAPTFQVQNRERAGSRVDHAFVTDLDWLMHARENLPLWVYGHTHDNYDIMVNNTRVYSNQAGYQNQQCYLKFNPWKVVQI